MSTNASYLHATAEQCNEYGTFITTSLGTTTTLICSAFVNANLSSTELNTMTVLIESGNNAGEMRYVQVSGLNKTTGTITVADAFTNAVASGVTFSLYGGTGLPAKRRLNKPGYLECVNWALRKIPTEDRIPITGVSGQVHYSIDLSVYPWWTDDVRIIAVESPTTNADDVPCDLPYSSWDWSADGETLKLVLTGAPFNTGQTGYVRLYRPGNSRLKLNATGQATVAVGAVTAITVVTGGYYTIAPTVTISGGGGSGATATAVLTNGTVTSVTIGAGGTLYTTAPTVTFSAGEWANQTSQDAGLLALSDEAIPDVDDVATVARAFVFTSLARMRAPGTDKAEWLAEKKAAIAAARRVLRTSIPEDRTAGIHRFRPVVVRAG